MRNRILLALSVVLSGWLVGGVRADSGSTFSCASGCPGKASCNGDYFENTASCMIQCYDNSEGQIIKSEAADCSKETIW